jgi:hypothetical protein
LPQETNHSVDPLLARITDPFDPSFYIHPNAELDAGLTTGLPCDFAVGT